VQSASFRSLIKCNWKVLTSSRTYPIERFLNKVGKPPDVIGVGIDGSRCRVADQHVFGEPPSELAGAFLVRCHDDCSLVLNDGMEAVSNMPAAFTPRMQWASNSASEKLRRSTESDFAITKSAYNWSTASVNTSARKAGHHRINPWHPERPLQECSKQRSPRLSSTAAITEDERKSHHQESRFRVLRWMAWLSHAVAS